MMKMSIKKETAVSVEKSSDTTASLLFAISLTLTSERSDISLYLNGYVADNVADLGSGRS